MTINQIQYFITLARYLNFTKASEKVFITQSALSKQISAIENELNMQLFVRGHHSVRLTPAGQELYEGLRDIYEDYKSALSNAKLKNEGYSGVINIGVLDGVRTADLLPPVVSHFSRKHPNIAINIHSHSFNGLLEGLYDGTLDLTITLYFDVESKSNLDQYVLEKSKDHLVVNKYHPLSKESFVKLSDFKDENFIIVDYDDSLISATLIIDACKREGFYPKVKFSPSIHTSMAWIQAGLGVGILDTRNVLYGHTSVSFLDIEPLSDPSLTLAWSKSNTNPYKELFTTLIKKQAQTINDINQNT